MISCARWPHGTVVLCLLSLLVFSKWFYNPDDLYTWAWEHSVSSGSACRGMVGACMCLMLCVRVSLCTQTAPNSYSLLPHHTSCRWSPHHSSPFGLLQCGCWLPALDSAGQWCGSSLPLLNIYIHTQARTKVFGLICLVIHSLLGVGGGVGLQAMMQTSVIFFLSLFFYSYLTFNILPPFISFFLFSSFFSVSVSIAFKIIPHPLIKKKKTKGECSLLGLRQFLCPTHTS